MNEQVKVSIICKVYNHGKYLRKCLDGFVNQKTNFNFEIIVHDDASTDDSADIIREYEKKYPKLFKVIYQTENQYSKRINVNWRYIAPLIYGKYIALCEGDDYWCDDGKLQKQADVLDSNPNVVLCAAKVENITEKGTRRNTYYPKYEVKEGIIKQENLLELMRKHRYPFQTSSYMYRSELIYGTYTYDSQPLILKMGGDLMLLMFLLTKGDFYYIDEVMSCYRNNSVGSWSERNNNVKSQIGLIKNTISAYIQLDLLTNQEHTDVIKKIIDQQIFQMYQYQKNYKMICNRKYRFVLHQLSKKNQIYYWLCYLIPGFDKLFAKWNN